MNNINWMSRYQYKSISQLTIPGSHDSFASQFKSFSHNDLHLPIIFNPIIKKWAKTQNKTITEQLELGIRYFDIRVEEYNNVYYTVHSLLSYPLYNILNEILIFVQQHPTEKILVDVNHLYNVSDELVLKNYMKSIFEGYLIKNNYNNLINPLNQIEGNIYLFFNSYDDYVFSNEYINSMWHNTNNINELIDDVINEQLINNKINITQVILTIGDNEIIKSFLCCCNPTSLEELNNLHKDRMIEIIREIKRNVIIMDFIDEEFINACLIHND